MSERVAVPRPPPLVRGGLRAWAPLARRAVLSRLSGLERGGLTLVEGGTTHRSGAAVSDFPVAARLQVHDPVFYAYVVLRGSIGAAESYALGHWDCDDLTALVRILAHQPALREGLLRDAAARLLRPLLWLAHRARRNTQVGSRRNITAHYDLGNEFFERFLDPTLTYSCAVFEDAAESLEEAQRAKYDRICRKLELAPGLDVLEIGTGWGGFAIHAAQRYGCRVVTTTISQAQLELARERIDKAGVSHLVTVLNEDYRDLAGEFDRLVSIEMIEAVGADYFDVFFETCSRRLRRDGLMLLQAILTPDPSYADSLRSVDFIKRFIFPGGQLPSIGAICASLARRTDLRLTHLEDLTAHYPTTLRRWHERFTANREGIRQLGYPERFLRLWDLYLCACEGNFLERAVGVAQIALAKPLCRIGPAAGRWQDAA